MFCVKSSSNVISTSSSKGKPVRRVTPELIFFCGGQILLSIYYFLKHDSFSWVQDESYEKIPSQFSLAVFCECDLLTEDWGVLKAQRHLSNISHQQMYTLVYRTRWKYCCFTNSIPIPLRGFWRENINTDSCYQTWQTNWP